MKHRDKKNLGRQLSLLMILIIVGASKGQVGLEPMNLTDQSLSAYSTDFLEEDYFYRPSREYESPNPKNKERGVIWTLDDMLTIDFDDLLGLNLASSVAGMKSIIRKSDVPRGVVKPMAIEVRLYLYDPDFKRGYNKDKKLIRFFITEGTSSADEFTHSQDESFEYVYNTEDIKDVIYNSDIDFGFFGKYGRLTKIGIRKVVLRIDFYYPAKLKELYIPGIGNIAPQKLLYSQKNSTFDPPSSTEKIVDFPGASDIYRWKWEGDDRLYGTKDNILNIAQVDFLEDSDLKLQLDYVFKDPRTQPLRFDPKTFKNPDGTPGIHTFEEMAELDNIPAEALMIDQPQSGMFDVVSHRAARAGALFAVNGAFYDYYYYCLPGVKTSLRIDNFPKYDPDIFNHRNTGALVFNDTQFDFIRNKKHDKYIVDEHGKTYNDAKYAYDQQAGWPNLMSGGHFSQKDKPYRFHMPKVNEWLMKARMYVWEDPESYYTMGDAKVPGQEDKGTIAERYRKWNEEEFGIWARIACQRFDNDDNPYSFSDMFLPYYLYHGGRVSIGAGEMPTAPGNLNNLYTAVDYRRYPHEFGVQKRGRTFIAKKDKKLYIMTADGEYVPRCQLEKDGYKTEKEQARYYATEARGLTIDELSDLSQKLEFDALLNLDGGGSSTFFVNGRGMLQKPYAGTAEGPMQQRYLSTTLMVVPKIIEDNIKRESSINRSFLHFDNTHLKPKQLEYKIDKENCTGKALIIPKVPYNDWAPVKALSLTPFLEKFTKVPDSDDGGVIAGAFKAIDGEGAILFAMSENGQYEKLKDPKTGKDYDQSTIPDPNDPAKKIKTVLTDTRSLFVIGVGQIPQVLIDDVFKEKGIIVHKDLQPAWDKILNKENTQSFYAILINNKQLEFVLLGDSTPGNEKLKYLDGQWHNFSLYYATSPKQDKLMGIKIGAHIDGESVAEKSFNIIPGGEKFLNGKHITHVMIGAIPLRGRYVVPPASSLSVDNYMFVIGKSAQAEFLKTLRKVQNTPDNTDISKALEKMGKVMADHGQHLPSEYTNAGFGWNDPNKNQWYLQFEEGTGYHAHAVNDQKKAHFYGLNLWGSWEHNFLEEAAKKEVAETAKALDSIVDPITDEPLNANPTLEFGSAGVSHTEEAPDASATNSLTEDTLRHSWNVYPNPASSSLFLDLVLEESTPLDIYLFNLSGQQLFHARSARMERGKNQVDLGEIARRFGGKQQLYTLKVRGNGFAPIDTKVMIK